MEMNFLRGAHCRQQLDISIFLPHLCSMCHRMQNLSKYALKLCGIRERYCVYMWYMHKYAACKGEATFQKLTCPSFLPAPTNVHLQRSKASTGEEWEGVSPSPADQEVWGNVESCPSRVWGGAPATRFRGHFICNFMQFHASFSALNSCSEMGESYIPLLTSRSNVTL